jgi:hypothetical protein
MCACVCGLSFLWCPLDHVVCYEMATQAVHWANLCARLCFRQVV